MSIVPISRLSVEDCHALGNNTMAAVLRDRLNHHRRVESFAPRRRWRFRPRRKSVAA